MSDSTEETAPVEDPIRKIVVRLARPHPQGDVIERAAILAEGEASGKIVDWIIAHAGEPEALASPKSRRGLHGAQDTAPRSPQRYVLPAGALSS